MTETTRDKLGGGEGGGGKWLQFTPTRDDRQRKGEMNGDLTITRKQSRLIVEVGRGVDVRL